MQPGEKYWRFQKFDRKKYSEVNDALKELTHLTAREWAIARLCADFKDRGRSQMTWIGENLPELVPFMEGKYQRQDVSSAQSAFKRKVVRSGTTFLCILLGADYARRNARIRPDHRPQHQRC